MSRLSVSSRLSPFGAEMSGDLASPLGERDREVLRDALMEHQLLVFHEQELSFQDQQAVMEAFGPVLADDPHQLGISYVTNTGRGAAGGSEEITYHYDLAYCPEPFSAISLHAVNVEDGRSSTRYVSGAAALNPLSPGERERLGGLRAVHVYPGLGSREEVEARRRSFDPSLPHTYRPVVWPHPWTGRQTLSVSYFSTQSIEGLDPQANDEVLDRLFAVLYAPENTYEHRWSARDLVIWDNLALQHARGNVSASAVGVRVLQKVVTADKGQAEQFPGYSRWRLAQDVVEPASPD